MSVMKFGYARVSTDDQELARQIDALNNYGVDKIYKEKITGTKASRPELDKLKNAVAIPSFSEFSQQKIPAIKVVREVTGLGLAEAKEFVEQSAPYIIVKDGLSQNQANLIAQKFQAVNVDARIYDSDALVNFPSPAKDKDIICCPQCGSTEYHAGARGFSIVTGFIGSGKTVLTCLRCGHRWKPGK